MQNMTVITFQGGLGNQMFQYLFLNLIKQFGYETYADISLYNKTKMHGGFILNDVFEIELPQPESSLILSNNKLLKKILEFGILNHIVVFEENFNYNKLSKYKIKRLIGDWQEQKYVEPIYGRITELFKFNESHLSEKVKEIALQINEKNTVAVHVRKGDYTDHKNKNIFGLCSDSYYFNAIKIIKNQLIVNLIFYIFSDDIHYAKSLIGNKSNYIYINSNSEIDDLFLMHKCKHQIIANSTFSWWGATLNNNVNKVVIYPKPWFDYSGKESVYIPTKWIPISKY